MKNSKSNKSEQFKIPDNWDEQSKKLTGRYSRLTYTGLEYEPKRKSDLFKGEEHLTKNILKNTRNNKID